MEIHVGYKHHSPILVTNTSSPDMRSSPFDNPILA
jgi:hypothetical protein